MIRLADLKGNIQAYPESDETFPRLKSQQRAVVQQLMASSDPMIQQALGDPSNVGFVKSLLGLADLVVPGEDSRNKQLREIELLLRSAPIAYRCERSQDRQEQSAGDLSLHDEAQEDNEARASCSLPCPWTCCSTITPSNLKSAVAGRIPMLDRSRASRIPRASPMCALMPRRICRRLDWRMPRSRFRRLRSKAARTSFLPLPKWVIGDSFPCR